MWYINAQIYDSLFGYWAEIVRILSSHAEKHIYENQLILEINWKKFKKFIYEFCKRRNIIVLVQMM